jgi:hypothetical protein
MPAIQLARLKIQAVQLAERFSDPGAFGRALHDLLDFYADRTYRPGQAGEPPPLLTAYIVPQPVIRQILKELAPYAGQDRPAALALCDALWAEPVYEFRLLAASLLGLVTVEPREEILARVVAWANPSTELRLLRALLTAGLARFRRERPEAYLLQVEAWLRAEETYLQHLGLQALVALLSDGEFDNLPAVFRLLTPLARSAPAGLRPDLLEVIQRLAGRSPQETAFFLRQNLAPKAEHPGAAWLARQSLAAFPPELESGLRAALRELK